MELPEIILIDKPLGLTSFDVIRQLRRLTGLKKFGHAGTLDPRATGLMLIGVGAGTKQLANLVKLDKVYEATVRIGESRTTADLEGEVLEQKAVAAIFSDEKIAATLATLVGTNELPVSAYSAIKQGGVPMYKRARAAHRQGAVLTATPVRAMTVYAADFLKSQVITIDDLTMVEIGIRFHVASGVYIRSLAVEIGKRLGYPATLAALRRTQVGECRVEDARTLDSFAK